MDLILGGVDVKAEKEKERLEALAKAAPVELMSEFLVCISEQRMSEAYTLCDRILFFEPDNKLILDYKETLREYIKQGLDEAESESESGSDKENAKEGDEEDEEDEEEEEEEEVVVSAGSKVSQGGAIDAAADVKTRIAEAKEDKKGDRDGDDRWNVPRVP